MDTPDGALREDQVQALGKVALLWRGDLPTRMAATPSNNRFRRIFEELATLGIEAEPAVYDEAFADEVREQLLQADGVLVWVNPLQDGRDRVALDTMLHEVANAGPWVSAHPETILTMGSKEVLVRTRHLGWGTDTHLYGSLAELRLALPGRLATGPRVLKRNRGNDGLGVWKVEATASQAAPMVRVVEAVAEEPPEELQFDAFIDRCAPYFAGGPMIDQPFLNRLPEGMVRCYVAADKVAGFAHQYPKGLLAPGHVRPHMEKRMFPPDYPEFRLLRTKMEGEWVPQMMETLKLARSALPVIWDADFLYGEKTTGGEDTFILCEINVSSVFAIPDEAANAIARVVVERLQT